MDNEIFQIIRPPKVCICKSVSREEIISSIRKGNHTIQAIARDTLATTGCGTCKPQVEKILAETLPLLNKP